MSEPLKIPYADAYKFIDKDLLNNCNVFAEHCKEHFKDNYFLYFDENLIVDKLDLEADNYDSDLIGYIINGDLKANKILNSETDYGVYLIVSGNIETNFMAVGGQEIYVHGNLLVKKLFAGSYNHGFILVNGNVDSPIIIISDYGFILKGELNGTVYGWGETVYQEKNGKKIPAPHENELEDIFIDKFLTPYDDIAFEVLVKAIDNNEDVLIRYSLNLETDLIASESVKLITQSDFLKQQGEKKTFSRHSDLFIATFKNDIEQLTIQESWHSYKYVIENNMVKVFFKEKSNRNFKEYTIGSNKYRRAKRLLEYNIDSMKYW